MTASLAPNPFPRKDPQTWFHVVPGWSMACTVHPVLAWCMAEDLTLDLAVSLLCTVASSITREESTHDIRNDAENGVSFIGLL